MYAIHHDETIWPDPFTFDPYRSSRVREKDDGDGWKICLVRGLCLVPAPPGRGTILTSCAHAYCLVRFFLRRERNEDDVGSCRAFVRCQVRQGRRSPRECVVWGNLPASSVFRGHVQAAI